MKTSVAGIRRLEDREGKRLAAYRDSKGIWTIGIGMTTFDGYPVRQGMTITEAQLDTEFAKQLASYEATVNAAVKVPLTQNQFDALVSFCWNIGKGGFIGSTTVRKLNAGDYRGAADAMLLWEKPAVLKQRREGEHAQFLTPDGPSAPVLVPPMAGPHILPAPAAPSLWSRITSIFTGKAA